MEYMWVIEQGHKKTYSSFVEEYLDHPFVKNRISRNISRNNTNIKKSDFWRSFVGCLLTSQQKSGAGTPLSEFMNKKGNKILDIQYCLDEPYLLDIASNAISESGLRFSNNIAGWLVEAVAFIKDGGWDETKSNLESISSYTTKKKERLVVDFLSNKDHFKGLGPKQSRNLIQAMGLSRYEIPLDSRMMKVLKDVLDFPVPLSSSALSDEDYYRFVEDGIQLILKEIDVYPCVFDACVFASFEK